MKLSSVSLLFGLILAGQCLMAQTPFIVFTNGDTLLGKPIYTASSSSQILSFIPRGSNIRESYDVSEIAAYQTSSGTYFQQVISPPKSSINGITFARVHLTGNLSLLRVGNILYLEDQSKNLLLLENSDTLQWNTDGSSMDNNQQTGRGQEYLKVLIEATKDCPKIGYEVSQKTREVDLEINSIRDVLIDYHDCVSQPYWVSNGEMTEKEIDWHITAGAGAGVWTLNRIRLQGTYFEFLESSYRPVFTIGVARTLIRNHVNPNIGIRIEGNLSYAIIDMAGEGKINSANVLDSLRTSLITLEVPVGANFYCPSLPGSPYYQIGLLIQLRIINDPTLQRTYPNTPIEPTSFQSEYPRSNFPKIGPWVGAGINLFDKRCFLEVRLQMTGVEFEDYPGGLSVQALGKLGINL